MKICIIGCPVYTSYPGELMASYGRDTVIHSAAITTFTTLRSQQGHGEPIHAMRQETMGASFISPQPMALLIVSYCADVPPPHVAKDGADVTCSQHRWVRPRCTACWPKSAI